MNQAKATTIQGIVIPDAWDEMGNVLSVAIFTYQEERIRVIDDERGQVLKNHIRMRVSVDGVLSFQGQAPAIRVRHHRLVNGRMDAVT